MDGKDASPGELCQSILNALFSQFIKHCFEKVQKIDDSIVEFDIASLFSPIQNPLFHDYLTYFGILAQHSIVSVIRMLICWKRVMFVFSCLCPFLHLSWCCAHQCSQVLKSCI